MRSTWDWGLGSGSSTCPRKPTLQTCLRAASSVCSTSWEALSATVCCRRLISGGRRLPTGWSWRKQRRQRRRAIVGRGRKEPAMRSGRGAESASGAAPDARMGEREATGLVEPPDRRFPGS
eukprot:4493484-Pleurochrysis_carterae.AAC.1